MGRPAKPLITKALAAQAALEVIDEQGAEGLSLELVARRVGVKAPSLYYHFHDKNDLLAEVARLILMKVEVPRERTDADWRERLARLAIATRKAILRHPHAASLMLQFFPRHLMLASYDHWLPIYDAPVHLHMIIVEGIEKLTFGSALFGATCRARGIEPMPPFDPERYPHLAAAVKANELDEDATFEATVRRFLAAF